MEYNNPKKYNELAHNIPSAQGAHPSKFVSISWAHSKQTLNTVIGKYEKAFKNWKISGYHAGFGEEQQKEVELQPFCKFVGGINSLLYLHEFVYQFPPVLSKVFGELPKWAFRESIKNAHLGQKQQPFEQEKKQRAPRSNPNKAALNQ